MTQNPHPHPTAPRSSAGAPDSTTGAAGRPLPVLALLGLALLGAPRVVLHDLGLLHEGTAVNLLLVVVPPVVWIGVVLWRRVPRPFLTVLGVGALYGVVLALTHQLLWTTAFAGTPPRLGGNLADLDPALQAVVMRSVAVLSSLVTGTVLGALTGAIAAGIAAVLRRRRPAPAPLR
ncbi:hypothetical protein [Brachybacterium sp. YJGR34]|uniref:hypothetical protein n=1 Tax=Brachybacterium sp. YJGR34 TaxID=2059911 RepID=UPI001E52000D|nr:hypothetical protein [Brachybacterium sp. YJGR34]